MRYLSISEILELHKRLILSLAAGQLGRHEFVSWIKKHTTKA